MNKGLPKIAWVGLGLLAIAAVMLSLGQRESTPFPATDSYAPSGTAALAALLRQQDMTVRTDFSRRPDLKPEDVAIVFTVTEPESFLSEDTEFQEQDVKDPLEETLLAHLERGGNAILLPLPADYLLASRDALGAEPVLAESATVEGRTHELAMTYETTSGRLKDKLLGAGPTVTLYVGDDGSLPVVGVDADPGLVVALQDGMLATNRFLDLNDHAPLILELVRHAKGKGGSVVFTEASFGNIREKGILETIGAWADAGWQQLLLLAAVVIYTLGKRLGMPDRDRRAERGTREFVDAIADTMRRSGSAGLALKLNHEKVLHEIRAHLKVPKDVERATLFANLPEGLQRALAAAEVASAEPQLSLSEAAKRAQKLDEEAAHFLRPHRQRSRRKATIRT